MQSATYLLFSHHLLLEDWYTMIGSTCTMTSQNAYTLMQAWSAIYLSILWTSGRCLYRSFKAFIYACLCFSLGRSCPKKKSRMLQFCIGSLVITWKPVKRVHTTPSCSDALAFHIRTFVSSLPESTYVPSPLNLTQNTLEKHHNCIRQV